MASVLDICATLPERQFATGEAVLEEGGTDRVLYVLIEGAVEIRKGDIQINTVADPGSIFGEVAVLLDMPHMATVKTTAPSRFYVAADPAGFLRASPEITLAVATLLARRLHGVTTYLVDLKRQFEHQGDHLGLVDEVLESLVHHQEPPTEPGSDRYPDPTVE